MDRDRRTLDWVYAGHYHGVWGAVVMLIFAGVATGAGMDMALMCDLRYACTSARFAETYVKVGLVPGAGGAHFLPRLVGVSKALEM